MYFGKPDIIHSSFTALSSTKAARTRWFILIAVLFLIAFATSGCIIHDRGHPRSVHRSGSVVIQPRSLVSVPAPINFTFTNHHRHLAHTYYFDHPHLHGKGPKWKKRWRHKRRSHLHPRIRMQTLPLELARQLPRPPQGTRYIYDDDQVLLINVNNREVIDFINISLSIDNSIAPGPVPFSFTDRHWHTAQDYYHRHPHRHVKKHKWKKKKRRKNKRRGRGRDRHPHSWDRNDVLPTEVILENIDVDLARQLPRPPRGTQYTYHEDQVLLINLRTRVILDFINISVSAGF